jgi:arsenate reductase
MAKTVEVYGIKACDTMKKARAWLDAKGIAYTFHDYKTEGIERATLEGWVDRLGWEVVLNRAGTTFRALPESDKTGLTAAKAVGLMVKQPSMIKRPMLVAGRDLIAGFKPDIYAAAFK